MVVSKGLLLKGLGVCALCAGGTAIFLKREDIKELFSSSSPEATEVSTEEIKKVRDPSGLECEEKEGGNCTIGEKVLVKRGDGAHFELATLGEGTGKIKRYKDDAYEGGYKFLIEEGDINGTGDNNKLEEFESYEVKLGGESEGELNGKHYLSRKTDAKDGIKKALGLSCDLPQPNETTDNCEITDNKVGSLTINGGTVTLSISTDSSKDEFPLGYKFTFKNTGETDSTLTTIEKKTITLKNNSPVEFKIKKEGSSLSLEKAWTIEDLTKKVGLAKESTGDFWDVGKPGINVKVDTSTKKEKIEKYTDSQGRIKVYKDQEGYSEGLKFTIEKGDLKLKEYVSGNTQEFYLGQFQSFEIVKDGDGKWYLSRKDKGLEKLKDVLGLPKDNCDLPTDTATPKDCTLSADNIKKIKFDGLGSGSTATLTGTPKLTISKETGRLDYPLGYKFTFSSVSDSTITIPHSSTPLTLRQGLSIEYKIKSSGENNQTLSLERAWTPKVLMERAVGFAESNSNEWTVAGDGIAIKQDGHKTTDAKASGQNAKIRVYEGTPGYNQGMKFVIEESDGALTNAGNNISKLTKYETYEISKDGGSYYFTRKKKSDESVRELLGIPDKCEMPTDAQNSKECTLENDSALSKIKFDGKGDSAVTVTGGTSVKLKITKETSDSYPLGYKFSFDSLGATSFTIPQGSSASISVANNSNNEFKIKDTGKTLTLEKVG